MTNNGISLNNRFHYQINDTDYENFIVPELRAYMAKYADPLTVCFKLMIDWTKPYGLFCPEVNPATNQPNVDSALSYLKRIGENERYLMLKQWIEIFRIFVTNYDFLILQVDGLESIVNAKPHESFNEDNDKLDFTVRETSDMMFQSLLTMYRHIWYDNNRGVEVLPANLRRFDCGVLVYNSGYYNMALYDVLDDNDPNAEEMRQNVETKMFPTLKKLSDKYFYNLSDNYNFNHHLIILGDAQISTEESGKAFFSGISNDDVGDFIKNNFSLKFRFGFYKGRFNNIFGDFDFVKALALAAAQDRVSNQLNSNPNSQQPYQETLAKLKENFSGYFDKAKDSFKAAATSEWNTIKKKPTVYANRLIGKNTAIGNALIRMSDPNTVATLAKNTIDAGIQTIEDNYITSPFAKLQNAVLGNFSDNFVSVYKNYLTPETKPSVNIELKTTKQSEQDFLNTYGGPNSSTNKNIMFGKKNIYDGTGF